MRLRDPVPRIGRNPPAVRSSNRLSWVAARHAHFRRYWLSLTCWAYHFARDTTTSRYPYRRKAIVCSCPRAKPTSPV